MANRHVLRVELQMGRKDPHRSRCAICKEVFSGYQHVDIHEFLVKRNAMLPEHQDLIFVPENCALIHRDCHHNSRSVDRDCLDYALRFVPPGRVADWYWILTKTFSGLPKGNTKLYQSGDWELYVRSLL